MNENEKNLQQTPAAVPKEDGAAHTNDAALTAGEAQVQKAARTPQMMDGFSPPAATAKKPFNPSKNEKIAAWLAFGIGYTYAWWYFFGFTNPSGFGAFVFTLFFIAWVCFAKGKAAPVAKKESAFWLAVLLCIAVSYAFHGAGFQSGGDEFATGLYHFTQWRPFLFCACAAYWVLCRSGGLVMGKTSEFFWFDGWMALLSVPFANFFAQVRSLFAGVKFRKKRKEADSGAEGFRAVITLLVMMPLFLAAIRTLAGADENFRRIVETMFDSLFSYTISDDILLFLFKFGISLLFTFYLFGLIFGASRREEQNVVSRKVLTQGKKDVRKAPARAVAAVLVAFCVLYALFLVLQASYLFSAFAGKLPVNFSVAQYAREGFFDLCKIAALNTALLAILSYISEVPLRESKLLQALSLVLCNATLLLAAVAISKMWLYVVRYGLTAKRFLSTWLVLIFVVITAFIMIALLRKFDLARISFMFCAAAFAALCVANPASVIVKTNIALYESGINKELDVVAIAQYGLEGRTALAQMLNENPALPTDVRMEIEVVLGQYHYTTQYIQNLPWQYQCVQSLRYIAQRNAQNS